MLTKPVRCKVLGKGRGGLSLPCNCAHYEETPPLRVEEELISCSWGIFFWLHWMAVLWGPSVRRGSVFQVIPWNAVFIAVNGLSTALWGFVCLFLICEEDVNTVFHCYRHAMKFPAFGDNCRCQHTQSTCKPCLVENLCAATIILEMTSKFGGIPSSVLFLFSRFGHEELIGLRGSLPCIPVLGNV